ncbi:hypothetical protein ACOMHN_019697 [Nucella lapillus]
MASRWSHTLVVVTGILIVMAMYTILHPFCPSYLNAYPSNRDAQHEGSETLTAAIPVGSRKSKAKKPKVSLEQLGVLASKTASGWSSKTCDSNRKFQHVSFPAAVGNLTFYVYDSADEDNTFTKQALSGWYYERDEMARFVNLSRDLPLIDVGGNLGLVALQAALQGRQVVSVEPIPENALRLCRSVIDFGHKSLVHVIQNAASSQEGTVSLAMDRPKGRARYGVQLKSHKFKYEATVAYSILLDSLLDFLPFKRAALKIDVESHEGHVLAGAHKLFKEVDIPLVWMEWEGVKDSPGYGAAYVMSFMRSHGMEPHHLMTGQPLPADKFSTWPRTVLWRKTQQ